MKKSHKMTMWLVLVATVLLTMVPMTAMASGVTLTPAQSFMIMGGEQRIETVGYPTSGAAAFNWEIAGNYSNPGGGMILESGTILSSGEKYIVVKSDNCGITFVSFSYFDAHHNRLGTAQAEVKWPEITHTVLSPAEGSTQIVWDEGKKRWVSPCETITETVYGLVKIQPATDTDPPKVWRGVVPGAVVDWCINTQPVNKAVICEAGLTDPTKFQNKTDSNGQATIKICSEAAGTTYIDTVAHYPQEFLDSQFDLVTEHAMWHWFIVESVKLPMVNWAGEERILEKRFGREYVGRPVHFVLENQSPGALNPIHVNMLTPFTTGAQDVWTCVDERGVARCDLICESPGEVDVDAILYDYPDGMPNDSDPAQDLLRGKLEMVNKHGFVVFFMKFEDVKIGNVTNFCDPGNTARDMLRSTHNVTEEQLVRSRVRGWFVGDNLSTRVSRVVNGTTLPAGRWILPDDWSKLAMGEAPSSDEDDDWEAFRKAWDTHDDPFNVIDGIEGPTELGAFNSTGLYPVIGPYDPLRPETMLADGSLDKWDCPMPPAKTTFKVVDKALKVDYDKNSKIDAWDRDDDVDYNGSGYIDYTEKMANEPGKLLAADKGQIYYCEYNKDGTISRAPNQYYAPFYKAFIPNSPFIPPFINNGGYDWNSYDPKFGPYDFWTLTNSDWSYNHNRSTINKMEAWGRTPYAEFPKEVQVYSDEHGEGMVWISSGEGFDLSRFVNDLGGYDLQMYGDNPIVGVSQVRVYADYPYLRKHAPIYSTDKVTKIWKSQWKKYLMVEQLNTQQVKVTAYLIDIHGNPIAGEKIMWTLADVNGAHTFIYGVGGQTTTTVSDGSGMSSIIIHNLTPPPTGSSNQTYVNASFLDEKVKRDISINWPPVSK